jgi:hypothetical protein
MNYTTKKYTRPVLLNAVKSLSVKNFTDVTTFANALSPRAGRSSAQLAALRAAVGEPLKNVLSDAFGPAENKRYLISLLKNND